MNTYVNDSPKIGIVCATPREALLIVNPRQLGLILAEKDPFKVYSGEDIAMIITGMRQSCAISGTGYLLDHFPSIQDVVNIGVAGSLEVNKYPIGSVALAVSAQSHDHAEEVIELTQSLDRMLLATRLKTARVLTGNKYISIDVGDSELERLSDLGDVVDMEAITSICRTSL